MAGMLLTLRSAKYARNAVFAGPIHVTRRPGMPEVRCLARQSGLT
jgi:hypothetical protein